MFDFLLTILHFFLLTGIILIALIIRKKSKLILLFCLLPSTASALVSIPEPGKGTILWEGESVGHSFEVIQIPSNPRPYLPMTLFFHEKAGDPQLWERFKKIEVVYDSSNVKGVYPATEFPLIQVGDEWGLIQETFRIEGQYRLRLSLKDQEGGLSLLEVPFEIQPQRYLPFKEEMTYFIIGTIVLGVVLFGLAYILRNHDTKR